MWAVFRKELAGFFSTLTGYVAGLVFLVLTGLLLWVLPGEGNILDTGQAAVTALFQSAPWVFLFLVPAITMRLFAEERREGTLEWLLCKPLRASALVAGKYLAALVLIGLMLLPTLVYVLSVYLLGAPRGSIDMGATWGSYLGLFMLAACYASLGLFASTLTRNAVVAFVLAALLSLLLYQGFASISALPLFKGHEFLVASAGMEEHYLSIRRGVLDSRDLLYFISVMVIALTAATVVLRRKRS